LLERVMTAVEVEREADKEYHVTAFDKGEL